MSKERCGIYQIRCITNDRVYIGSSKQIYKRWGQHRNRLRKGLSLCRALQRAWTKHGEERFHFSILEECSVADLAMREQHFINTLRPAYNLIHADRSGALALSNKASETTHCVWGHLYDDANTYLDRCGNRICRACNAERVSKIYASETPEQREERRIRVKAGYEQNRAARLAQVREYQSTRKAEKAAYDRAHKADHAARQRQSRAIETPERRAARLQRKRDGYHARKQLG